MMSFAAFVSCISKKQLTSEMLSGPHDHIDRNRSDDQGNRRTGNDIRRAVIPSLSKLRQHRCL